MILHCLEEDRRASECFASKSDSLACASCLYERLANSLANKPGADIALITAGAKSTIGALADAVYQIGTSDSYAETRGMPMRTAFELSGPVFWRL